MPKRILKRFVTSLVLLFISSSIFAQAAGASLDQTMRSNNKIYVVMAVCLVILVVFIIYLIRLDSKISKLEKKG